MSDVGSSHSNYSRNYWAFQSSLHRGTHYKIMFVKVLSNKSQYLLNKSQWKEQLSACCLQYLTNDPLYVSSPSPFESTLIIYFSIHSVSTEKKSILLTLAWSFDSIDFVIAFTIVYITPDAASTGNKTNTESQFFASPKTAHDIALANSSRSAALPNATSVEVTDVPMLAPIIIKIACWTVRSPAPTILTIILVDVDELCTITVIRIPAIRPNMGMFNKSW